MEPDTDNGYELVTALDAHEAVPNNEPVIPPLTINPFEKLPVLPDTSNLYLGVVVPTPILPLALITINVVLLETIVNKLPVPIFTLAVILPVAINEDVL